MFMKTLPLHLITLFYVCSSTNIECRKDLKVLLKVNGTEVFNDYVEKGMKYSEFDYQDMVTTTGTDDLLAEPDEINAFPTEEITVEITHKTLK